MNPKEFVNTIYLGDRGCKSITIDGFNEMVKVQVDMISRIRSASGNWEFYNEEDIEDGIIVFECATKVYLEPPGFIPNDATDALWVEEETPGKSYMFCMSIENVDKSGKHTPTTLKVLAKGIHLEDPRKPGREIVQ